MGEITKIQWCDAAALSARTLPNIGKWGKGAPRKLHESAFSLAKKLNHRAEKEGRRMRVFSLSLGDWLDDEIPIRWLSRMLDTIRHCEHLDFILVTKRPENWRRQLENVHAWHRKPLAILNEELLDWVADWLNGYAPENVWVLTSVENQEAGIQRIPYLLTIPAKVHGLSCEPLLSHLDLTVWLSKLKWVIVGGESGRGARPCLVTAIGDMVDQCTAANVPVFVKQLGADSVKLRDGEFFHYKKFKHPKAGDPIEWPISLQRREFPTL